jgi:hypothetical protein
MTDPRPSAPPTRYWIGVASREHVLVGTAGGFCQLCHGKAQPLRRMAAGDWLIYYSPTEEFRGKTPCRRFTAIGQVLAREPYRREMAPGFVPHRRDIRFVPAREAPILPLLDRLSFIKDKRRWGYPFRFGHFEIQRADFEPIATQMLGAAP